MKRRLTSYFNKPKRLLYICFIIIIGSLWTGAQASNDIICTDISGDVSEAQDRWTERQLVTLCQLWIGSLPPLPDDPTNVVADNPVAIDLGHHLFFDTRLSQNGDISCASCHDPQQSFTDGLPVSVGLEATHRNSMTIVGTTYSPWLFWDGRKDSQWSQTLEPLENPIEHGMTRTQVIQLIAADSEYNSMYTTLFGELPAVEHFPTNATPLGDETEQLAWNNLSAEEQSTINTIFTNIGKVIAAYERQLQFGAAPFDDYVEALLKGQQSDDILSDDAIAGIEVFIEAGQCINCHNGPLLTNNDFHNTGVQDTIERARLGGVEVVLADPFNCLGNYSDGEAEDCGELNHVLSGYQAFGAWRTPTLRNITDTAPYMHAGQFSTLLEVINHYNTHPNGEINARLGHLELMPINLSDQEVMQLVAFLQTLSAPLNTDEQYLSPPE